MSDGMMNRRRSIICAVWLAAAAGGFLIAKQQAERIPDASTTTMSATPDRQPDSEVLPVKIPYASDLASAGLDAMRGFFAEYDDIVDPVERRKAMGWLIARWVELDPEDALIFFRDRNGRVDVKAVLVQWAMRDPEAAAKAVHEGVNGMGMESEVWGALTPAAAVRFALASPDRRWLEQWATGSSDLSAIERIAKHDFGSALSLLSLLPVDGVRRATRAVAEGRAALDPQAALQWARSQETGRTDAVAAVLGIMAKTDPEAAAREFLLTPELLKRVRMGDTSGYSVTELAVRLGQIDPARAVSWIQEVVADEKARPAILSEAVSRLLQTALDRPETLAGVFRAAEGHIDPDDFFFPRTASPQTLDASLQAVRDLPPGAARDSLLASLAAQSAVNSSAGDAARWLEAIADPQARVRFVDRLLQQGGADPGFADRTDDLYAALPADVQAHAAQGLARLRAEQNGQAGAEWAQSLPENAGRSAALASAIQTWTGNAPTEASAWADALPAGPDRDAAAAGIVEGIVRLEPSSAFAWANNIGDPALRATKLGKVIAEWKNTNPVAAQEAMKAAGIP